jgi:asparagine synthase (glutamine-hydrolysing)
MAQIFGCLWSRPHAAAAEVVAAMGERMRRPTQGQAELWSDPDRRGGIGALLQKELGSFAIPSPMHGDYVIAVDGRIEVGSAPIGPADETLASRYQQSGADFVSGLGGSFALAFFDRKANRLVLATDRLSTRAIFWLKIPGGIAFSSELKGLLAIPDWQAELDPQAIASYLRYGRLFGRRTMCRNVELLTPGHTLVYDLVSDAVGERVASCLEATVAERQPLTRDRLQAMGEAFADGVGKGCPSGGKVGLSLSGGLDSRGILAVLAQQQTNTVMRTEGMEGCMDQRVGARLAAATGFPWCFQPLKQFDIHSYVEAMRRYMYLTEGMLVPEGFPGIGPIRFAEQEALSVLQRGHGGENARVGDAWPFQVKDDVLALQSREDLVRYVEPTTNGQHADVVGLFQASEVVRAVSEPEDTLMGYARAIDGSMTPAETMSLMYLRINDGGQVTAFRNCLRGYADMALPYLDDGFLDLVLGTKVSDRRGEAIHYHLIQAHCPALMKVINSNHGAPLDSSHWRRLATEKAHALFRKLRLPGFRHYHYVDAWMQKLLRESVRAFLLDPRSLSRGLINPAKLKQIIEDPSQPGRSRLLVRLVAIEMWGRLFADNEIKNYQLSLSA